LRDQWCYIWGSTRYSSVKVYNLPYKQIQPPQYFLWLWKSRCSNKLRVFAWLLLMDRLHTRNILRRKKLKIEGNNYNCVLCDKGREETAFHLFFSCPFSKICWDTINIGWDSNQNFETMMVTVKQRSSHQFFMDLFRIGAWNIWKQRNGLIFNKMLPSIVAWKRGVCDDLLQAHRFPLGSRASFIALTELVC
jgi:hypothetical protein